ncbi:MAG TPA: hypothetical protein VFZ21_04015 [Gemmatimonadaceae bacterium]|nr:hypothetical protein [Gemmatimonadaceae bacterium]
MGSFSLVRFHASAGARVASRNAIGTICLIIIVLGSAPDPLILLRRLALGVAADGAGSGPLIGLTAIAYGIAREAVPRLTLGLGGWTRSLPATGMQHRRGVMFGLPMVQTPLAAAVVLAVALTLIVYDAAPSWPKLLGAPLALCAAGAAAVPARRWLVATPAFAISALLAAMGRWTTLAAALALFVVADVFAGPIRFPDRRAAVPSPTVAGSLRVFRFTWRAIGWRVLAPLPLPFFALAAAWFYTRNNELGPADVGFVTRLWSVIAIALYVGALGDIIATRRPAWPWLRSLPWSSTARATDDTLALAIPALAVAFATALVDVRSTLGALVTLPPLAALAAAALPGARRRLTRVSGLLIVVGVLLGTASAYVPWVPPLALVLTPLVIRAAAARGRREVVTGWKELYHDAAGDSLAWSTR